MAKKPGKPKRDDLLHVKLRARAAPALAVVRDIRRQIITPVPTGSVRTEVKGLTGSLFPTMVRDASDTAAPAASAGRPAARQQGVPSRSSNTDPS